MLKVGNNLEKPARKSAPILCALACVALLTGCATTPRIQTDHIPTGSLRLTEVMILSTRKEILENKQACDILFSSGLKESDIKDGSIGVGRVYCCGGPNEESAATMFFIPAGIPVHLGDIVEIQVGHLPTKSGPGVLHTVTRVRQPAGDEHGTIRWDPPNDRLWMRVLYGDWMPGEGWVHQGGLWPTWYKPPPKE